MENNDEFECQRCPAYNKEKERNEIAILKCKHSFCWTCLDTYIQNHLSNVIKCPIDFCSSKISDAIIRKTLSEEKIKEYENICLGCLQQSHHCLLPGCSGFILYTDPNLQYQCHLCSLYNCVLCKVPHNFETCKTYQRLSERDKKLVCETEIMKATEVLKGLSRQNQREIFMLENEKDILTNEKTFTCNTCSKSIQKGQGVKLRNCSHELCRDCLKQHIVFSCDIPVNCPSRCDKFIDDCEIQNLLSLEEIQNYQSKCNMFIKRNQQNYLQCKFPNCDSFFFCTEEPETFICKKCNSKNCVSCGTVHDQETCEQYQNMKSKDAAFIEEKIKQKEIMKCPDCKHLLRKTKGCNWIKCDKCFVELCWIRQMHRWGPKGRGDISGGCGCGIKKKMCHPDCRGCIPDIIR